MSDNNTLKKVGIGAAIAGTAILCVALIPITMGFSTAGIVAGSAAAGIQAGIGSVVAGSAFAVCTSLGMTGVFATSAAVGAMIGAGGLALYIKNKFDPKTDAELIDKVINNKDNPDIIIKLIEIRFPNQRNEIKTEYEKIDLNKKFESDIINFIPDDMKQHFKNLMTPTKDIEARTIFVQKILENENFEKYFEKEFDEVRDVRLINEVMKRNDEPLIIARLLNSRDEAQRKMINDKCMEMKLNHRKNLLSYIKDYMNNHVEMEYIILLLAGLEQ